MAKKYFVPLPAKQVAPPKQSVTVRIDKGLLMRAERLAKYYGLSRNELLCQCIRFAILHADPASEMPTKLGITD